MEIMRLVITGPVGAGKSTFIRSVSEIETVDTDKRATDDTGKLKEKTTVAFDFGRLQFGPDMALHLYGTPGQTRFDFMWDILIRKAHAYMLLIDVTRPQEFLASRRILSFMRQRSSAPFIIGLTHRDLPDTWSSDDVALALGYISSRKRPPIIDVIATDQASVAHAVLALTKQLLAAHAVTAIR